MENFEIREAAARQTRGNIFTLFLVNLIWMLAIGFLMSLPMMDFFSKVSGITDDLGDRLSNSFSFKEFVDILGDLIGAMWLLILIAMAVSIAISSIMEYGMAVNQNRMFNRKEATVSAGFEGIKYPGVSIATCFMRELYLFLWFLIPVAGIYFVFERTYAYSCALFIIQEDKSKGAIEAIAESKKIINGRKWKMFCLDLYYFFVWYLLLGVVTFGVALIWGVPRHMQARYNLYQEARKDNRLNVA